MTLVKINSCEGFIVSLKVPKTTRLNVTHYFIMKILNERELQQIASNHSADIEFKDFIKLYKD